MAFETLFGFLEQSNISAGNVETIHLMSDIDDEQFRSFLELVQEIARLHPRKRRRWKWLRRNHPDVLDRICQDEHFYWLRDLASVDGSWESDDMDYENDRLVEQ